MIAVHFFAHLKIHSAHFVLVFVCLFADPGFFVPLIVYHFYYSCLDSDFGLDFVVAVVAVVAERRLLPLCCHRTCHCSCHRSCSFCFF